MLARLHLHFTQLADEVERVMKGGNAKKVTLAENGLVVSAYRCVDVAGRNRKNAPRPTSPLRPAVTRRVRGLMRLCQIGSKNYLVV
jgi:hypothetical protein